MAESSKIVAVALEKIAENIQPGISTKELNDIAEDYILSRGGKPAFKGYKIKMGLKTITFPAAICASINEEVVHGIPSKDRILKEGDIVSVDIGVEKNGYYGDAARTYPVGEISDKAEKLLKITKEALKKGIEQAKAGNRLSDISSAVQDHAENNGCSVVREYVGHGIGRKMHEEPQVPNYVPYKRNPKLKPGYVLAIEPMVNLGGYDVHTLSNDWTVVTKDKSLSAHFEHTVAILDDRTLILTTLDDYEVPSRR
jgi:methionyl aminopeptidase